MANCSGCGREIKAWQAITGLCETCHAVKERNGKQAADKRQKVELEAIVLTTESNPDLNITKRIEIVTAECAFGMNIFKDLFAGVRDIVGGRSEAVQKAMRDSRKTVLYELKKEAYEVGANAVVGVDLDYVELSNVGSMVMLVASGTAVVIAETDDASQT
jgi:uncharacterized protein YbjQ (UPF0145 family)